MTARSHSSWPPSASTNPAAASATSCTPPTTPRGTLLSAGFAAGLRLLADARLLFDICIRPRELGDALQAVRRCPKNTFILDHCGNADPKVVSGQTGPSDHEVYGHERQQWLDDIAALGRQSNVICKISGIVHRAPTGWTAAGPGADRQSLHRLLRRRPHRVRQRLAGLRTGKPAGGLGRRAPRDRQQPAGAAPAQAAARERRAHLPSPVTGGRLG